MDPERRKRINLYKKIIVTVVLLSVLVPLTLCVVLFCKVCLLKNEVKELEAFKNRYYAEVQQSTEDKVPEPSSSEEISTSDNSPSDKAVEGEEQTTTPAGSDKTQMSVIETQPPETTPESKEQDETTGIGPEETTATEAVTEETTTVDTRKKVYLTFDDGPSSNTNAILDILKEYNAKATFFVNGKNAEVYADTYRRIVEEGHTLAMHSYTHVYADVYSSVEAFMADMHRLREYLYELTGVTCDIYRFPGGSSNAISKIDMREFGKALAAESIVYYDWNVESRDAVSPARPAEEIYNNVTSGIVKKETPVVLMHDMKSKVTTVEALPQILQFCIEHDYNIVALDSSVELVQHVRLNKE